MSCLFEFLLIVLRLAFISIYCVVFALLLDVPCFGVYFNCYLVGGLCFIVLTGWVFVFNLLMICRLAFV